ncbi:MAG: division/cell wall cluster transcriptional repressor MraZ [Ruminococcaceae bacterium]|nr:division/cell wall cluster transcriptional repressor MraZ [Oscillospiraceae bacterium]
MLYGRYEHTVDAKNRVFVPAKYKEVLGSSFKLTCNGFTNCIMLYSEREWERFEAKIADLPTLEFENFIRQVYSNTVDVQIDSQGRFVIPQFLKEQVGIEKNVLFMGVGTHIEIWSQEAYQEKQKTVDMEETKKLMIQMKF